jgi:hypothetical protein
MVPGCDVKPEARLRDEEEVPADEIENLLVIEPSAAGKFSVNLQSGRLEEDHQPSVMHRRDIPVHRIPIVGDKADPADRRKALRKFTAPERGMPTAPFHQLDRHRVTSTFEQHYILFSVQQIVQVVQYDQESA